MSIRLHRKYGVNPTMPVCFWCGEPTGEIALLGAAYRGEAPRHMCFDKTPCDKCMSRMAQGITLMEGTRTDGQTGRYIVVSEALVRSLFTPESVAEDVIRHRKAMLEPDAFAMILEKFEVK